MAEYGGAMDVMCVISKQFERNLEMDLCEPASFFPIVCAVVLRVVVLFPVQ